MKNIKTKVKEKETLFKKRRFDTKIKTIEKDYGIDLGVRGDMKLGNYLKKKGFKSLSKMLEE
jgi:hypothetical protein